MLAEAPAGCSGGECPASSSYRTWQTAPPPSPPPPPPRAYCAPLVGPASCAHFPFCNACRPPALPPARLPQVVFAPHLPPSFCCFEIQHDGVWGVAFGEQQEDEDGDGARGLQVHAPGQPAGMTMP